MGRYFRKGSETEKLYFGKSRLKKTATWGLRTFTFHRKGLLDLNKNKNSSSKKKKKKRGVGYIGRNDITKTNSKKRKGFCGLGEIPAERVYGVCGQELV